jgi:hypothetical protein
MIRQVIAQTNIPAYPTTTTGLMTKANSLTVGDIVGGALPYIYVIAGLALLFMLISGGITLMTAAGNPNKSKEGYGKITAGLVGFLIIFISYFVLQIVETVLGVSIF